MLILEPCVNRRRGPLIRLPRTVPELPWPSSTSPRWNISFGEGQPLAVIAGLNVLEDLDLALEAARELKAICADLGLPYVFKASFDKANRSSIKSYRGPGLERACGSWPR